MCERVGKTWRYSWEEEVGEVGKYVDGSGMSCSRCTSRRTRGGTRAAVVVFMGSGGSEGAVVTAPSTLFPPITFTFTFTSTPPPPLSSLGGTIAPFSPMLSQSHPASKA
jgi:hypothetical protein